jgi:peptidoglycan/xylan/chitin deacetylase (PgdA/CDA1 family)
VAGQRNRIFRAALEAMYFSGAHVLLRPVLGGVGVILTLHHVRPPRPDRFQPNRLLEVTPEFFERVVRRLRSAGDDLVSLDEMHRRIVEQDFSRRFVCITFDDGYRDTLRFAYPILKKYDVPFAVYLATSFADRVGEMWWLALEAVIAKSAMIGMRMDGRDVWFECDGVQQKRAVFEHIYWWLRHRQTNGEIRKAVRDLAARYHVDVTAFCQELCMTWPEIAELAVDPLVTVGAHTVDHVILAKVAESVVRAELLNSRSVIEAALGVAPRHFAYPVGDATSAGPREFRIAAELGYKTAVTTRPGVIFPQHAGHLLALPRVSLNGEFQQPRYARVLVSGAATGLWNGFRRLNVA